MLAPREAAGKFGAHLMLDSNTLTPMVKRMETAGWLVRARNPADERQVLVHLTEAGQTLVAQIAGVPDCFVAQTGLDPDGIEDLRTSLAALRDRMRPR